MKSSAHLKSSIISESQNVFQKSDNTDADDFEEDSGDLINGHSQVIKLQ